MKATVYIYKTDGIKEVKEYNKIIPLEDLRSAVGGSIETVPYWTTHEGKPCVAFCNEEGKLRELPLNGMATIQWYTDTPSMRGRDVLVGDVIVIMGDKEFMRDL